MVPLGEHSFQSEQRMAVSAVSGEDERLTKQMLFQPLLFIFQSSHSYLMARPHVSILEEHLRSSTHVEHT